MCVFKVIPTFSSYNELLKKVGELGVGYEEDYTYTCCTRSHNTEMSVVTWTLSMNTIFKETI